MVNLFTIKVVTLARVTYSDDIHLTENIASLNSHFEEFPCEKRSFYCNFILKSALSAE